MNIIKKDTIPLDEVEPIWLRRLVTITLGIFVLPVCLMGGLFIGIKIFWIQWLKFCW